jgi:hypothetical protein
MLPGSAAIAITCGRKTHDIRHAGGTRRVITPSICAILEHLSPSAAPNPHMAPRALALLRFASRIAPSHARADQDARADGALGRTEPRNHATEPRAVRALGRCPCDPRGALRPLRVRNTGHPVPAISLALPRRGADRRRRWNTAGATAPRRRERRDRCPCDAHPRRSGRAAAQALLDSRSARMGARDVDVPGHAWRARVPARPSRA